MVSCGFQETKLVNNYRPRKSARTFVSRLELAINYIRINDNAFFKNFTFEEVLRQKPKKQINNWSKFRKMYG